MALLTNRCLLIDGDKIAAITPDPPSNCDIAVDLDYGLVLPGFLNLHNHCLSSVPFRGLTEGLVTSNFLDDIVFALLLPLGDLVTKELTSAELKAVLALGLLEVIKGGSTTLVDQFRNTQTVSFDLAEEMGLRFYGAPYLFSPKRAAHQGPTEHKELGQNGDLKRCLDLFYQYDGAADGRIRVAFGPHGTDTCEPELLRAISKAAQERNCPITLHFGYSWSEVNTIRDRYGMGLAEYLDSLGLLGPRVLAVHCICCDQRDLRRLQQTNTTIVHCPRSYARGGVATSFQRFADEGIRTTIGTDGYCMDMVGEISAAGILAKLASGRAAQPSAWELVRAVTIESATALGREDIGRIAPGCRADLLIVDMERPHLQPVSDPITTFVWNAGRADVWGVMVDGRLLVREYRYLWGDELEITRAGRAAVQRIWEMESCQEIVAKAQGNAMRSIGGGVSDSPRDH
jgi:cytosine/adenosine deaminase-related metal-dependent hydrolase